MTKAGNSQIMRTITLLITIFSLNLPAYAKYSGGTGEPNDPYQIATAADLIALGETPADYDKHFILTADIDLHPNLPGRKVFDRAVIGSFTAIFDGNGHTISHLTIHGKDFLGLFGRVETRAEVKNLGVQGVGIAGSGHYVGGLVGENYGAVTQCYSAGVVSSGGDLGGLVGGNWGGSLDQCHSAAVVCGTWCVGGVVGYNDACGEVTNCYSTGVVAGGSFVGGVVGVSGSPEDGVAPVTDCYSTGAISGTDYVGGVVGDMVMGAVRRCHSLGSVSGGSCVGGLVGRGGAVDCWSMSPVRGTGKMVGGLVGYTLSEVTQCYSSGTVSGDSDVGGLVGYAERYQSLTQSYSSGLVTGISSVGGLVGATASPETTITACFWDMQTSGQTMSAGGMGKTTAEMQDPNTFMAAGWDFVGQTDGPQDIWAEPHGGGYPILWSQLPPRQDLPGFSGGSGDLNDPYRISTAKDLNSIGHNPRLMQRHFKLIADIDLTGVHFYLIGDGDDDYAYGGVFDGNGHTISHLTIEGEGRHAAGVFCHLRGEVRSLGVVDINVTGEVYCGGGLAASNSGCVTQCYSTGTISSTDPWCYVGGLLGDNYGVVTQSYSTSTVSAAGQWWNAGGLVCYNVGAVIQCYSTGAVGRGNGLAGSHGQRTSGSVIACFWDTQTSGMTQSMGGTGKTTAEMQTAKTFLDAGWDFVGETANGTEDIWKIAEGLDYPRLWWEAEGN